MNDHASTSAVSRHPTTLWHRLAVSLPQGRTLPESVWLRRHRALLTILWLHAPALTIFALARGYSLWHSLLHGAGIVALALLATVASGHRRFASAVVSFGLITCSALLVHTWGGVIEGHFHFFVVIALLALYEDWLPFLLAAAYVVVHHGLMGVVDPSGVYNTADGQAHPWKWAAIHGAFVAAAGVASVAAWRLNEDVRAETLAAYARARESEERFKGAFDEAPIGMALSGIAPEDAGCFIQVNRSLCDFLGRDREELVGRHFDLVTHPADMQENVDLHRQLLEGAISSYQFEKRYVRPDGTTVWGTLNVSIVRDEHGEARYAISQVEDISKRKQAEDAVLQSQRQLAEAQKLAHIGSWEWDIVANQMSWSDELYRIYGLDPQIWSPTHEAFIERLHSDDRARVEAAVGASLETLEPFRDEYRIVRAGGDERVIEARGEVLVDEEGSPVKLLGTAQDVTDKRLVQEELQLKRDAERAHKTKNEFLSRISHELRTPLNAILGFAQVLELGDLTADEQQSVKQILKGGTHLLELINEVLEISRVESGNMSVSLEPVYISEITSDVLDLVAPLASQHQVTLDNRVDEHPDCHVLADRQRLKQVMLNLLSNGIKYNREGGSVTVSLVMVSDERVLLMVTDTGKGIPADRLAQVFDPFDRLGAEQTSIEGTGLGLTLSKLLVEGMGGTLGVESEPWVGSTFIVSLPATKATAMDMELSERAGIVPAVAANGSAGTTILYVEDNLSNFKLVERLLAGRLETRMLTAMEGNLGLELARQHVPDLILLDLHLPVMDGPEVLRRLKSEPATREIPVVVVSADATPKRVKDLLALGATAFLTKPLDVKRFMAVIDDALNERIAA